MPLELWTGKPGSGKTLNLLFELEQWSKKNPDRPIYYHGIPELTLEGWRHFEDPRQWETLPAGSLLVVDEAQKHFPVRDKGTAPSYVTNFSTHRHLGIDLVLITQDPMLVDVWIRRLVNRHCHVVRPYGSKLAIIYEWQQVTDIGDPGARKQALVRQRLHPKHVYTWYKSADLHTVQARPPLGKLIGIAAAAALAIGLSIWVTHKVVGWGSIGQDKDLQAVTDAANAASAAASQAAAAAAQVQASVESLRAAMTPEVEGLPWSAPFYRQLVQPADLPVISGCARIRIENRSRCVCNDQQGAVVSMSRAQCEAFMREGDFDWSGRRAEYHAQLVAELESRQRSGGMAGEISASPSPAPAALELPDLPTAALAQ